MKPYERTGTEAQTLYCAYMHRIRIARHIKIADIAPTIGMTPERWIAIENRRGERVSKKIMQTMLRALGCKPDNVWIPR